MQNLLRIFAFPVITAAVLFGQEPYEVVRPFGGIPLVGYRNDKPIVRGGQVVTLFVQGLGIPETFADSSPLPTVLAGVRVRIVTDGLNPEGYYKVPILSIRPGFGTAITIQLPKEMCNDPRPYHSPCLQSSEVSVEVLREEQVVASFDLNIVGYFQAHVLHCQDSLMRDRPTDCWTIRTERPDGTLVLDSNLVQRGEEITIFVTGLTAETTPMVPTGAAASEPTPVNGGPEGFRVVLTPNENAGLEKSKEVTVTPEYVGLQPGEVGVYRVTFRVPEELEDAVGVSWFSRHQLVLQQRFVTPPFSPFFLSVATDYLLVRRRDR